MAKKERMNIELRYYEKPMREPVIALFGENWIRQYGRDGNNEVTRDQHFHNLMELGYCVSGEGEIIFDGKAIPYKTGNFTIIPINFPHTTISKGNRYCHWEYIFCEPVELLGTAFAKDPVFVEKTVRQINSKAHFGHEKDYPELCGLIKSIIKEMEQKKPYYSEKIVMLSSTLLLETIRVNGAVGKNEAFAYKDMSLISEVIEYIDKNYNLQLRVKELAEICKMSETNFRRVFAKYMGSGPLEYIKFVRVNKACDLIKTTLLSMEDVSNKVGYTQISTFNRNFNKIIGTSPYNWKCHPENYESKLRNSNIRIKQGW